MNDIEYRDGLLTIEEELFNDKNTSISLERKYQIIKSNNDIFILYEKIVNEQLQAYRMDNFNYLLFSTDFDFYGILLKDISEKELEEIHNSRCL